MAARSEAAKTADVAPVADEPLAPSSLDQNTHNEMLMLYRECADSVRFAKVQQWKTLAGALALFIVLGLLGRMTPFGSDMPRWVIAAGIALSVGAIYSLFIYQFWQATERAKLAHISNQLSNLLRKVRAFTSRREASIHRYVLLAFMIICILAANALLWFFLAPRLQPPV
jgi:hypothetical protein